MFYFIRNDGVREYRYGTLFTGIKFVPSVFWELGISVRING